MNHVINIGPIGPLAVKGSDTSAQSGRFAVKGSDTSAQSARLAVKEYVSRPNRPMVVKGIMLIGLNWPAGSIHMLKVTNIRYF